MKTITTTEYWASNRNGIIWSVQQSENDIILFRHNTTKVISVENLLKNYHKIYTNEKFKKN
jgi:hypothetical protein